MILNSLLRFKYKSSAAVTFVMMKEVYGIELQVQRTRDSTCKKICVVACKRYHFDFWSLCKHLQNIVNARALYATMVLSFWVLKRTASLRQ